MKKIFLSTAMVVAMFGATPTVSAGDIGVSVSTDYVSEYVFRGVSFADAAIQPGIELSKGGFSFGAWYSAPFGGTSAGAADELDLYGGYGWDIADSVSASVGFTIFHFPQFGELFDGLFSGNGGSTLEVYGGLSFDTALAPSITAYYDIGLEAFTLEGSVGHSFTTSDKTSLDLGLTAGLVTADGGGDYEWATASASYSYAFTDDASVYIGGNFSLNSEDLLDFEVTRDINTGIIDPLSGGGTDGSLFWVGTGFSTSF